ncbi:hypothetical protein VOLCADRAFT_106604 [Volvox carteri f. nagariensis]|uniref:Uncharacterized protein n=1 Tax=Volvox carteri f. nagariensis TaxID=3068 RepID=D8U8H7_VOLCA|nr:uncharacterized protein VOLCADRAFT_106604 [Volvox carteri f. nagariensis]EFJ43982.1 hypothetical protein VOLCADRAFT_106604 [Volvox carteri f. nagariensis]|eukprot:XP_002954994.1 hypothetical protein VOLCADRAFT_106604 [Volvox carteri f. nagariensis]
MSSDLEEDVGGEEEEVIAPPDDTYADDDFDGAAGDAAADDEPTQAEASYAADDEYKEEPEPEPEPSRKAVTDLDEEPSYQDDFEQSAAPGVSKMPDEDEDPDATSATIDEPVDDGVAAEAGTAKLQKSASGASRTSSTAGSRTGSTSAAAAVPKTSSVTKPTAAAPAPKPAAAPKPGATGAAVPKAAAPKPTAAAAAKPMPVSLKPAVSKPTAAPAPAPKPAVPRAAPVAAKPVAQKPPAPTGVGAGGQKVKLTFTGPPNTQRAAPTVKPDYSHSKYEVKKINSDNIKLCNRLVEISRAPPNPAYNNALSVGSAVVTGKLAPANVAAATVNRHRKEDKIAQENLALYKRLQAVKPSPTINREVLNKDYAKTVAYGENARKVKAPPPQQTATNGGTSTAKLAASSGSARQPVPGSAEHVYSRPSATGSDGGSLVAPDHDGSGTAAADLSTVMEGPEGETSDVAYAAAAAAAPPSAAGDLEPEYSMDPEFDQAPTPQFEWDGGVYWVPISLVPYNLPCEILRGDWLHRG